MAKYDFKKVEKKWQKRWLEEAVFRADDKSKKPKFYQLETFPYPSAEGLHVGHPKGYIAEDIHARYMRMNGREVLYTIGWDAFGLPTENYAIKVGKAPKEVAEANVKNFKRQVRMFGLSYDWDREINTSEPEYYKWTQWLFIQLYKKGLAYRAKAKVNWCPKDMTVLANEQVVQKDGKNVCERCGAEVEQRDMDQWFLKITDYAERLLNDLKGLDWPEATVKRQEDWIGKSEGAEIEFRIRNNELAIKRFVLLHGRGGHLDQNFFRWLKDKLETQGYEVEVPILPGAGAPNDDEQADYVIKNCKLDEQTAILGHSFGGIVALRVLERGIKLGKVVLVATPSSGKFLDKKDRPTVTEAAQKGFKFDVIKSNCSLFDVLIDSGDSVVPSSDGEFLATKLGVRLHKVLAAEPHFGAKEEPGILDLIIPKIKVFTTRPDTLFGATYLVLSPEYELIANNELGIRNYEEVQKYIEKAKKKTELERMTEAKDKTGVELEGVKAINPATKEEIPVWVADYVLGSYGTGAIMAVPAHDERDFEFAQKFKLP
ncbi:MAG: class I tRNA ligase family protein, partial [bacterium]|nr:class I tRNA ligase family protein [bacterium]